MADGTVKWFDKKKGYGFIRQDNGQDVFVHHTGINGKVYRRLFAKTKVTFDIKVTKKGQTAVNVSVVK
jgi:CspA family cold shock protein